MTDHTRGMITIYCLLNETCLIDRVKGLSDDKFKIVFTNDINEAVICTSSDCVILVEKDIFPELKQKLDPAHSSIIIVSSDSLDLSDTLVNIVPKELFLTKYLEEFIFWTIEKTTYIKDIHDKKKMRGEKIRSLIKELNEINKQPIIDRVGSGG